MPKFHPPLDAGIEKAVNALVDAGIETFESCEGGPGHAYAEPTVRFHGGREEGFRALAAVLVRGLPVSAVRRTWPVLDGEPTGPWWEMVFRGGAPLTDAQVEWVVNDIAELGVKIGDQFFWLYKGESLVYKSGEHDGGKPLHWRHVGKREFGETCHPIHLKVLADRYEEGTGWLPLSASTGGAGA